MRVALVWLAFVVLALVASPAGATLPGRNGPLAFSVYVLNPESTDIDIVENFVGIARLPGGPRHIFARGYSPAFRPTAAGLPTAATTRGEGFG